jgi:hypothetical protein
LQPASLKGHFGASIGATDAWNEDVLFPDIKEELTGIQVGALD